MNKLIIEILPYIERVANHTTQDYTQRKEIHQELVLKCYDNKEKVAALSTEGTILNWLYIVARNIKADLYRNNSVLPLEMDVAQEPESLSDIDNIKTLDEMLSELTPVERIWIAEYIDCGFNIAELHRRTTISRRHATRRIKYILERWKQLDIYLPQ